MSFKTLLNTTATTASKTNVSDAYGTWTETWADTNTNFPCRIQPLRGDETVIYGREGVITTHKLYCETSYSFTEQNKLTSSGTVYDIVLVRNIDGMNHHIEADLKLVKP